MPHAWILKMLQIYHVNHVVVDFLEKCMPLWMIVLRLVHEEGCVETEEV